MEESRPSIQLNFYVLGSPPDCCTTIAVSPSSPISALKVAFAKEYKTAGYGEVIKPTFYKVDRSPNDLSLGEEDRLLGGFGSTVGDFWPEADKINMHHLHVLVRGAVHVPPDATSETDIQTVGEPEDVSEVATNIAKLRIDFLSGLSEDSSSEAAQPAIFRAQQATNNYILNGRPAGLTGPPIVLYHPVFGNFLRNLKSLEPLSAKLYEDTAHYLQTSQDLYPDESSRRQGREDSSRHLLGPLLGDLLLKVRESGAEPDGVFTGDNGAWCIIMEMKNEIGSGASDPSIQAAQSYTRAWKGLPGFTDRCCCPSILIAIAGPWMSVLGAIFLDRPVIQPLTGFLWVGHNPSVPSNLDDLARVFYGISQAREELKNYYAALPDPREVLASFFPYLTEYVDPTGRTIKFQYKKHANRIGRPSGKKELVFFARTLENPPKKIVVKFATRYHSDAHRLLAEEGLAPELLYDGTMYPKDQPGPEHFMVVMEYVNGGDLGQSSVHPPPLCVSQDVERAIQLLHAKDLVFGDLRMPNIMLEKDKTGLVIGAKLIDFEWCGKHHVERYPLSMNQVTLTWAPGMRPGQPLDKDHDIKMFHRLRLL
ncbi:unnamed protein product [Rhizoctonia solani]|uniref:Protein kinase domain-containing protein n=1 Tax=Rhizoctonia solani TaxID=456999 RepID=A0A8H3B2V1_9AGAM|nr:unnamed protein product [Rhizoctonia solani]